MPITETIIGVVADTTPQTEDSHIVIEMAFTHAVLHTLTGAATTLITVDVIPVLITEMIVRN